MMGSNNAGGAGETPDDFAHEPHDLGAHSPEQLDLADHDEHLPWLESGSEEGYNEYEGGDTKRMFGLVVMGLIALAAIVGGIFWATHRNTDPALVADGSTIAAADQAYKDAPKNPGGKTFEGTGDSSFAVSEGQNHAAKLGENGKPVAAASNAAKPADHGPAAAATGGVAVQVGAYSSKDAAETGWSKLVSQVGALGAVPHRVVEGTADIGTVYRLQAITADQASASGLCGKLKTGGVPCQIK